MRQGVAQSVASRLGARCRATSACGSTGDGCGQYQPAPQSRKLPEHENRCDSVRGICEHGCLEPAACRSGTAQCEERPEAEREVARTDRAPGVMPPTPAPRTSSGSLM